MFFYNGELGYTHSLHMSCTYCTFCTPALKITYICTLYSYLGVREVAGLGLGWPRGLPGDIGREGAADLREPAGVALTLASRSSLASARSS